MDNDFDSNENNRPNNTINNNNLINDILTSIQNGNSETLLSKLNLLSKEEWIVYWNTIIEKGLIPYCSKEFSDNNFSIISQVTEMIYKIVPPRILLLNLQNLLKLFDSALLQMQSPSSCSKNKKEVWKINAPSLIKLLVKCNTFQIQKNNLILTY